MVNDHTRSAENWKCVWYLLRLYIRVYVDSHSLGQLALASKRTDSDFKAKLSMQPKADMVPKEYTWIKPIRESFRLTREVVHAC